MASRASKANFTCQPRIVVAWHDLSKPHRFRILNPDLHSSLRLTTSVYGIFGRLAGYELAPQGCWVLESLANSVIQSPACGCAEPSTVAADPFRNDITAYEPLSQPPSSCPCLQLALERGLYLATPSSCSAAI